MIRRIKRIWKRLIVPLSFGGYLLPLVLTLWFVQLGLGLALIWEENSQTVKNCVFGFIHPYAGARVSWRRHEYAWLDGQWHPVEWTDFQQTADGKPVPPDAITATLAPRKGAVVYGLLVPCVRRSRSIWPMTAHEGLDLHYPEATAENMRIALYRRYARDHLGDKSLASAARTGGPFNQTTLLPLGIAFDTLFLTSIGVLIASFRFRRVHARLVSRRNWHSRVTHCPRCRYDRRGLTDRICPECGWPRP